MKQHNMHDVSVRVTRKHITEACQGDSHQCAIARALVQSDPDIVWADVRGAYVRIARKSDDMIYKFHSPAEVADFVTQFDLDRKLAKPQLIKIPWGNFTSCVPRRTDTHGRAEPTTAIRKAREKYRDRDKDLPTVKVPTAKPTVKVPTVKPATPKGTPTAVKPKEKEKLPVWTAGGEAILPPKPGVIRPRSKQPRKYNQRSTSAGQL